MTASSDNLPAPKGEEMTAEQVERFLRDHPRFLAERPGLADSMSPPQRHLGDNVVDLQAFMIDRLRADRREDQDVQDRFVERTRRERSLQDRIHAAALAMIGDVDLDHLVEIVTSDLAILLGVDLVALAVETASRDGVTHVTCGVRCLPRGTVADLMEDEREVVLRAPARADERIFGSGAMLVESEAMVRFGGDERLPQAILALGSRLEDRFRPGDPVELYRFLGGVLDRCLRKKLGLPA
ncbi:MAG: DUF484 family protein [Proteobacteria bacterium]|nr:DUF484 family protein [Pseudomonadota bacterium]MDA0951200.1 DUF484 family protein [Pseudomonadota bacterium]